MFVICASECLGSLPKIFWKCSKNALDAPLTNKHETHKKVLITN